MKNISSGIWLLYCNFIGSFIEYTYIHRYIVNNNYIYWSFFFLFRTCVLQHQLLMNPVLYVSFGIYPLVLWVLFEYFMPVFILAYNYINYIGYFLHAILAKLYIHVIYYCSKHVCENSALIFFSMLSILLSFFFFLKYSCYQIVFMSINRNLFCKFRSLSRHFS